MTLKEFGSLPATLKRQAWELYEVSFPPHERRSLQSHAAAMADPDFRSMAAVDEQSRLLGILFYWLRDDMLFVEHIAVNPELRGQNIGSRLIGKLVAENPRKLIILEIDPPVDEISVRRRGFYERLGFIADDREYIHPSYAIGEAAHPHKLILMSHGRKITPQEFDAFKCYIFGTVLKYVD